MAMQIVALKRKNGSYEGRTYDNFYLTVTDYTSTNQALVFGPDVDNIKIKAEDFKTELGRNIGALNNPSIQKVQDIEGLLINPIYNKFGTCTGFNLSLSPDDDRNSGGSPKK